MATTAYEPDTVIVDVEERPSAPRRPTAELTMQVHHDDGRWHRRTPDLSMTACGKPLFRLGQMLRHETYAGEICGECFTPFELAINAQLLAAERAETT